jgi:hypothetical protein
MHSPARSPRGVSPVRWPADTAEVAFTPLDVYMMVYSDINAFAPPPLKIRVSDVEDLIPENVERVECTMCRVKLPFARDWRNSTLYCGSVCRSSRENVRRTARRARSRPEPAAPSPLPAAPSPCKARSALAESRERLSALLWESEPASSRRPPSPPPLCKKG